MPLQATICTGCSLLCDDVEVEVRGQEAVKVMAACSHGVERFKEAVKARPSRPTVSGREASMDEAVEAAAELLRSSRRPLIYDGQRSTNRAVELMVRLAEKLRGVYCAPNSICHYTLSLDRRLTGARLDDVLEDADFIVYWASDPSETHLRHASRYAVFPRGRGAPMGRESRVVAVVDVRETGVMRIAQHRLIVQPGGDAELASALRELVEGRALSAARVAGVGMEELSSTARDMARASYVAFFVGGGLIASGRPREALSSIARLAEGLMEAGKRASITPMAERLNSMGQAAVAARLGGSPSLIDYSGRGAVEAPIERLLEAGEVDAALIVKGGGLEELSMAGAEALSRIPTIALEEEAARALEVARVKVPVAVVGVEEGGAVTRMDGVEVELKPPLRPPETVVAEEEFLERLLERL
ncbi:hypothetical protein B6U99_07355 [Candidatus Geothermarchaeota archaeon ex4572_27]|nr:MAG: hypothetical protein B6U99_07355 [Candidatus Geothermarchaeota archaeon ex4572_27]